MKKGWTSRKMRSAKIIKTSIRNFIKLGNCVDNEEERCELLYEHREFGFMKITCRTLKNSMKTRFLLWNQDKRLPPVSPSQTKEKKLNSFGWRSMGIKGCFEIQASNGKIP